MDYKNSTEIHWIELKRCTYMLLSLAFVPEAGVLTSFAKLCCHCPAELHGVYDECKEFFFLESQQVVNAQPQGPDI